MMMVRADTLPWWGWKKFRSCHHKQIVTSVGNNQSLRLKKTDEKESYAGELCQIIDNSENEGTNSECENYSYELNNTYAHNDDWVWNATWNLY